MADDSAAQPLNLVRGGAVCQSGGTGAHVLKGSWTPAVCMPTPGNDDRSRWRNPYTMEKEIHHVNRHSVAWAQRRGTRTTQRGLGQR